MAAEVDEFLRDLAREFRPRADQLARDLIQAARAEVPDEWTHAPLAAQEPATTISSPPIDCYVLDDVTEADFADIICERPCTDPNCGCDGCSDERYRVRDAFNQSSQPLLAESVVFDHLGRPMFWASGPTAIPVYRRWSCTNRSFVRLASRSSRAGMRVTCRVPHCGRPDGTRHAAVPIQGPP